METTVELTADAAQKIAELIAEENNPNMKLRTYVQGGGCAGFSYGFTFDDTVNDDDHVITRDGVTLLVDSMSMQYLAGSVVDYSEDFMSSSFTIKNPNAESTCGCGSSFSPQ